MTKNLCPAVPAIKQPNTEAANDEFYPVPITPSKPRRGSRGYRNLAPAMRMGITKGKWGPPH